MVDLDMADAFILPILTNGAIVSLFLALSVEHDDVHIQRQLAYVYF